MTPDPTDSATTYDDLASRARQLLDAGGLTPAQLDDVELSDVWHIAGLPGPTVAAVTALLARAHRRGRPPTAAECPGGTVHDGENRGVGL